MTTPSNFEGITTQFEQFLSEFAKESDRSCAIVGAAYLDEHLGGLLTSFVMDDKETAERLLSPFRPYAPLSSFAARSLAAYMFGFIDKIEYEELKIIRRIRNKFAHGWYGLSFEDPDIEEEVKKLNIHRIAPIPKTNRTMFMISVSMVSTEIRGYAKEALENRRTTPDHFGFINDKF